MKHALIILMLSVLSAGKLHAQTTYTPYAFTNFAGLPGGPGNSDGPGNAARFRGPDGVAVDVVGNIYIADANDFTIRKITPAGAVTTLAGSPGQIGTNDGPGISARFGSAFGGPSGITVDGAGNVYVSDTYNYTIRRVAADGTVTTLAGAPGLAGYFDSTNGRARFIQPYGVAVDAAGNIYVADGFAIRRLASVGTNWVVTTIAGSAFSPGSTDGTNGTARFGTTSAGGLGGGPRGLAMDGATNIYVADFANGTIRVVAPVGPDWVVSTLAGTAGRYGYVDDVGSAAEFSYSGPYGIGVDAGGALYVTDAGNLKVRKVAFNGTGWAVTTLAGSTIGSNDGNGAAAQFNYTKGVAVDGNGLVYVADFQSSTIRRITQAGDVTTFAGLAAQVGSVDGTGSAARFNLPNRLATDHAGNIYVADTSNHTIRRITPSGEVTTLAGKAGSKGSADGSNGNARFSRPNGLAVDSSTNIYVAEFGNSTIRMVSPVGTNWVVTTLAGVAQQSGTNDGTGISARFNGPFGVAVDNAGTVYVADTGNGAIRKITPSGTDWVVTTFAGVAGQPGNVDGTGPSARFNAPHDVAVDSNGDLFVSDGARIRKVTAAGVVTSLVGCIGCTNALGSVDGTGTDVRPGIPLGLAVGSSDNVFFADNYNDTIRMMTFSGGNWTVTTLGGSPGQGSGADGVGSEARFNGPAGVAVDSAGNLYVANSMENQIVRATAAVQSTLQFDTSAGSLTISNGVFHMRLVGPSGGPAVMEASSALTPQSWSPIQTNILTSGSVDVSVSLGTIQNQFFRARLLP